MKHDRSGLLMNKSCMRFIVL